VAIPDNYLQELTARNPIEDVVGSYVALTKRSGSNMFGLCPFHSEKTPSFSVSPDKQIYHCFGCGKGGGVINFIMEVENLSFRDAVSFLARRAGMPEPENEADENAGQRTRMLELNRDAARFFHECLKTHPDREIAVSYIAKRGISPAMVTNFGIGFAPDTWDSLLKAMRQKGYSEREMFDAGLIKQGKNGGFYDVFRSRLMFPVIDVRGSVIGFSGRILGDGEPKYLNSRETLVFNKSRSLFALNLAKKSKNGYIILSEGNIDVVSLHQAGFDSAAASLGTSLTPEQARLISRYAGEVVIAYDNDTAGKKAAQRAIGIMEKLDLKVRVLSMEGAKDPDEFIKAKGPDAFARLLEGSKNHIEYRLARIAENRDLSVADEKVAFLQEAAGLLAALQSPVEREVYAARVAETAGVGKDAVEAEVRRLRKAMLNRERKENERAETQPAKTAQPEARELRYENIRSARAEEGVLRLLLRDPALFRENIAVTAEDFSSPVLGNIFLLLQQRLREGSSIGLPTLAGSLSGEEISLLTRIEQEPENIANGERALADYIKIIHAEKNKRVPGGGFAALAEEIKKQKGYGG